MSAKIIRPEFGFTAQNRENGYVRSLKERSPLVAEMSRYHSEIKAMHGWKSSVTGKPHRFLIFAYTEEYGLEPVARSCVETAQAYIDDIYKSQGEDFLAVLRLDEPFETQWPTHLVHANVPDLARHPVDTRFRKEQDVVLKFSPLEKNA